MYHRPVMLQECLDGLAIRPDGVYVDLTFGGGGHARGILERLGPSGRLIGFDQDPDAVANAPQDTRFALVRANFRHLVRMLRLEGLRQVDGILADLGVSSHQLDDAERGFTHREDTCLDMRMSREGSPDAAGLLNSYSEQALQEVLSRYGEVRNAKTLAQALVAARRVQRLETTGQLLEILDANRMGDRHRYFSQVFQALRIEVNDEMGALQEMLQGCLEVLRPGGRLVVLTYHSLEDRPVKNFLKAATFDGSFIQDEFGHIARPFKAVTRKPLLPGGDEIRANSRARSAKLRIAEKI